MDDRSVVHQVLWMSCMLVNQEQRPLDLNKNLLYCPLVGRMGTRICTSCWKQSQKMKMKSQKDVRSSPQPRKDMIGYVIDAANVGDQIVSQLAYNSCFTHAIAEIKINASNKIWQADHGACIIQISNIIE